MAVDTLQKFTSENHAEKIHPRDDAQWTELMNFKFFK